MKTPAVLGIDPGRSGALCCVNSLGLGFYDYSTTKDSNSVLISLKRQFDIEFAVIEKQWLRKDEKNLKTAEVLIRNAEMWATLLTVHDIPFILSAPATWRSGLVTPGKQKSIAKAKELFPIDAKLITRHDRAEAALIAYRAYKHVEAGRPLKL